MIQIASNGKDTIGFDLPTLIDTRLLIQANSGGGKSYAIRKLLEETHGQIQQIVLDLEGEFSTLREKFDYIIAGRNGDTAAHPSSAKLLARKILELEVSIICDLYELKYHERITFVRYFLESLMSAPRELWHPTLVIIDEAHHFASQHGEVESYAAVIDLCTRGRKRGFSAVLATQRLSKLHKDACAELLNKMIGRTSLDIDQARAADELGFRGKEDRLALRNLHPGEFHIYGPALCLGKKHYDGVLLGKVGAVQSRHPKVGARQLEAPPKPTARIKEILGKLADLPAEAEKETKDLGALRKENADLKRKLTMAEKGNPAVKPCNHLSEIAELNQQIRGLQERDRRIEDIIIKREEAIRLFTTQSEKMLAALIEKIRSEFGSRIEIPSQAPGKAWVPKPIIRPKVRTKPMRIETDPIDPPEGINRSQQKILNALLALEQFGVEQPEKATLAAHSGFSPGSGGYNNNLSSLRTAGLIDYPKPACVCLTDMGREGAINDLPLDTIEDLQRSWLSIIRSRSQRDILIYLISIYPDDISKAELAEKVNKSAGSGGFNNNISRLRTLGAIEYTAPGRVRASELLFPEGL